MVTRKIGAVRLFNGLLLTAVLLPLFSPLLGFNFAAHVPTHRHIYFHEIELAHHHDHGDTAVNDDIAFLPSLDVGGVGLIFLSLLLGIAGLVLRHDLFCCCWRVRYVGFELRAHLPLTPPPTLQIV